MTFVTDVVGGLVSFLAGVHDEWWVRKLKHAWNNQFTESVDKKRAVNDQLKICPRPADCIDQFICCCPLCPTTAGQ
jgi:hypothetical protein